MINHNTPLINHNNSFRESRKGQDALLLPPDLDALDNGVPGRDGTVLFSSTVLSQRLAILAVVLSWPRMLRLFFSPTIELSTRPQPESAIWRLRLREEGQ